MTNSDNNNSLQGMAAKNGVFAIMYDLNNKSKSAVIDAIPKIKEYAPKPEPPGASYATKKIRR